MAPEDSEDDMSQTLLPDVTKVISDYVRWYGDVLCEIHAKPPHNIGKFEPPASIGKWLEDAEKKVGKDWHILEDLEKRHHDLCDAVITFSRGLEQGSSQPSETDLSNLRKGFESVIMHFRESERAGQFKAGGRDIITGARDKVFMTEDLNNEMYRLNRQGQPFCLVMALLDGTGRESNLADSARISGALRSLVRVFYESSRPFDEIYNIADNEFVMCLKQTDVRGAMVAVQRMISSLRLEGQMLELQDGRQIPLSFSACVIEPLPHDDLESILAHAKDDLLEYNSSPGTLIEYVESSDLERFLKQEGAEGG